MAARRIAKIFLLLAFIGAVAACNLGIQLPDYFIDVRTKDLKLAYNNGSGIEVEYKFIAELEQHRCEYVLTNGSAVELERELTEFVDAGQWQTLLFDVATEGKYSVRIIVQSETADGHFVDMNFLNEAVVFYFDQTAPVDPPGIEPAPMLSSIPLDILLTHPDQTNPNASPVILYYTLDGTAPTGASSEYIGPIRIGVPAAEADNHVELRVIAVDAVNLPSPEALFTYNFLDVQLMTNPDESDSNNVVNSGASYVVKDLHGFGFAAVDEITVYDHDLTSVSVSWVFLSDIRLGITIYPNSAIDPNDPFFEPGSGTVEVIDSDTGIVDTIDILIQ